VLVVSEHDHGFLALVNDLRVFFPRIVEWRQAVPPVQFQLTSVDLWVRARPGRGVDSGELGTEDAA